MFCGFENVPMILRLYGQGRSLRRGTPEYAALLETAFGNQEPPGARQIIRLDVETVQTSCGYGVPAVRLQGGAADPAPLGRKQGRGRRRRLPARKECPQHRRLRNRRDRADPVPMRRRDAPAHREERQRRGNPRPPVTAGQTRQPPDLRDVRRSAAILVCLLGYLLGSIPFGLLLTRIAGLGDIRGIGSGNIGATNVLRTGRKGLAAATLVLDGLKGAAAVLIARAVCGTRTPRCSPVLPPSWATCFRSG